MKRIVLLAFILMKPLLMFGQGYAVDLGLPSGVKWASCNLGASQPWEIGNYYAFGETSTKSEFSRENYKYYDSARRKYTRYSNTRGGYLMNSDDAAAVNWGNEWRMPCEAEMYELSDYCHWTYSIRQGVPGLIATGPNGNSIFFPFGGLMGKDGGSLMDAGFYRSASYGKDGPVGLHIGEEKILGTRHQVTHHYLHTQTGSLIRPVCGVADTSAKAITLEVESVHSKLKGSSVFIDGKYAGTMPCKLQTSLGRHHVMVAKEHYRPFEKNIVSGWRNNYPECGRIRFSVYLLPLLDGTDDYATLYQDFPFYRIPKNQLPPIWITDDNLDEMLAKHHLLIVHAQSIRADGRYPGRCVLDDIVLPPHSITFGKHILPYNNDGISKKYNVEGWPFLLFFKDGVLVDKWDYANSDEESFTQTVQTIINEKMLK